MFANDRSQLRAFYHDVWQKHLAGEILETLESQVLDIIVDHPEYQALLGDRTSIGHEFQADGEVNPFLHMGLHAAVRDQLATDRPAGIRLAWHRLRSVFVDRHGLEHAVMRCFGECLAHAQRSGSAPDEARYLRCVADLSE